MSDSDRRHHQAFIALGSNIDPQRHLPLAVEQLRGLGEVITVSAVYESPPVDGANQANYLNAAVLLMTELSAEHLCRQSLRGIEADLGRVRDPDDRYAARTIDLDLVLYDDAILTIDHRQIPDPEIAEHAFLAIPLAELEGDRLLPTTNSTLAQLAAAHRQDQTLIRRPDVCLRPG